MKNLNPETSAAKPATPGIKVFTKEKKDLGPHVTHLLSANIDAT